MYYDLYQSNLNTYLEKAPGYVEHQYQTHDVVFDGLGANATEYPKKFAGAKHDVKSNYYFDLPAEGLYLSIPTLSGMNTNQVLYEDIDYEIHNYTQIKFKRPLAEYNLGDFTDDVQATIASSGINLMTTELPKRKREVYLAKDAITLLPTITNLLLPAFGQDSAALILDSGYYTPFISGCKSGSLVKYEEKKLYANHLAKTCQAWMAFFKSKPTLANLERLYALIKGFPFTYKDGIVKEINKNQDGYDYIVIQTLKNTVEYIAVGAK